MPRLLASPCNLMYFKRHRDNNKEAIMPTIMPQSELTRKAVKWICEMREEKKDKTLSQIIELAAMQFNLGPRDVEFIERFFRDNPTS